MTWNLYCPKCGWQGESEEYYPFCPKCGSPLEIRGIIQKPVKPILGEGNTPLVKGYNNSLYKLEYLNPTGSFKDRGVSLSVWLASRLGYDCVVEDSSGNTALSVAAYGGRLGLKVKLHVPRSSSIGKLRIARFMGAEIVLHDSRGEAAKGAVRDSDRCFYVAHAFSPIFIEGVSTIAEELPEDTRQIILPVSSGSLLLGVYRGLRRGGLKPRIIAVQSPRASSLVGRVRKVIRKGTGSRLLDALVYASPPRIEEMSEAVDTVVVTGDSVVSRAWRKLVRSGFIVEPSSASVLVADEVLGGGSILLLTGSGLKYHELMVEEIAEA